VSNVFEGLRTFLRPFLRTTLRTPTQAQAAGLIALGALLYMLATLAVDNRYYQLILTLVPLWATVGVAWNLFSGYSGLMSFGHAAFFGLGAYTVALGLAHHGITPWLGLPAAAVVGAVAGLLVGLPTLRLRGHYFALAMLAYPLALLYTFEWLGYQEVALPMHREAPFAYMQFADQRIYVLLAVLMLVAALLITLRLTHSRFGLTLLAIKQNEAAAMAAGIDPRGAKLRALVLSAALTALAGGLYAVVLLIVTPAAVFGMHVSAQPLILTLFGGVATVLGPVVGALALVPLGEVLHAELGDRLPGIQGVVFGAAIIGIVLAAPQGLLPWLQARWRGAAGPNGLDDAAGKAPAFSGATFVRQPLAEPGQQVPSTPLLQVRDLSVRFGGLQALGKVSFDVHPGEILGIIGPNGAGKTTLFNALNGFVLPSSGSVLLQGQELVGRAPYAACHAGLSRTFQVVRPFARLSVLRNVVVGAYSTTRTEAEAYARARQAIAQVGLQGREDKLGGALTTVELRLLELARALAAQPKILLLDETLAGLGANEVEHVLHVIEQVRQGGVTVVIIEHTMQAMVRLAHRLLVLDHGEVLASGEPRAVTANPKVVQAYLGKKWLEHVAA
jgi:ABC-type branched-subunit amino acid transport system ATPase component/ABC-type branched-subunit amino acid transport system permease subunit